MIFEDTRNIDMSLFEQVYISDKLGLSLAKELPSMFIFQMTLFQNEAMVHPNMVVIYYSDSGLIVFCGGEVLTKRRGLDVVKIWGVDDEGC